MIFEKLNWKLRWDFTKLKDWKYKASEVKETRSLAINKYYWLCLDFIIEEYKNYWYVHTKDLLHKQFKKCFLPRKRVYSDYSKNYIYISWSTANLSNKEFVKYLTNIKVICEFGKLWEIDKLEEIWWFIIPDPEDRDLYNYIDNQVKKWNEKK